MGHADMEFAHSIEDVTSTYRYYLLSSMLRGTTVTVCCSIPFTFHRKSVCFNPLFKKDLNKRICLFGKKTILSSKKSMTRGKEELLHVFLTFKSSNKTFELNISNSIEIKS